MKELRYQQESCPEDIRKQIIEMLLSEWPGAYAGKQAAWPTEPAECNPISIMMTEEGRVVSHAVVMRKSIRHCGEDYLAFGLGSVVTMQSHRKKGYGQRVVQNATQYIKEQWADIGVFTCEPQLRTFYERAGWQAATGSPLVGGTSEKPLRSDELGKITLMQLFSARAKAQRIMIASVPIVIELGEGRLW